MADEEPDMKDAGGAMLPFVAGLTAGAALGGAAMLLAGPAARRAEEDALATGTRVPTDPRTAELAGVDGLSVVADADAPAQPAENARLTDSRRLAMSWTLGRLKKLVGMTGFEPATP